MMKRKPTNKPSNQLYTVISIICIGLSTIGMISINFFDNAISKREKKINYYSDMQKITLTKISEVQQNCNYEHLLNNTAIILNSLGNTEQASNMRRDEILPIMRKSAYMAINTAGLSGKINEEIAFQLSERVRTARQDSIIQNIYINSIEIANDGINSISGAIAVHLNKISSVESWKKRVLILSIIFQIFGLFLRTFQRKEIA